MHQRLKRPFDFCFRRVVEMSPDLRATLLLFGRHSVSPPAAASRALHRQAE